MSLFITTLLITTIVWSFSLINHVIDKSVWPGRTFMWRLGKRNSPAGVLWIVYAYFPIAYFYLIGWLLIKNKTIKRFAKWFFNKEF